ncbi:BatD family protein [Stutzerimonas azotifigens]|uniref:BatD family protein n=1 Tax=Stutzerimonas azotifigens TaxID=291995 RepID=UPI000419C34C|nr:BatD family protein [Stutzerimonas azotifigens]
MTRLIALLLLFLTAQAGAAGLQARVDRTQVGFGETFELILESEDGTQFANPDLTPLADSFVVSATRRENRLVGSQGQTRPVTRWLITLQPRHAGQLQVPALSMGQWRSEPILLQVQAGATDSAEALAPVFIDASLDQDQVYVQAQVVLTLRIYHSVSLYEDSTLSPLQMTDALVERLGDVRTYEKLINGVRHGVIEVRYAIFPQKSGELAIPSQLFRAVAVAQDDPYSLLGPRTGRATEVKSPSIPLQVRPIPPEYPRDIPWLPARRVTLAEAWNPEPAQAKVGDSLTRSLLLQAEGLSSAQLPPLGEGSVAGARRYPDQPNLANQVTAQGVMGSREERIALVPTHPGRVALPALTITWWNTEQDRLERTELPARELDIQANPDLVQPPLEPAPMREAASAAPLVWPWQLGNLVLACTTLLGFGLWLRARRQPAVQRAAASGPSPRTLLDDIRRACLANDSQATRQALDAWARNQPETLADMAARFVPLSDALDGLNGALYSETGQQWQGDALWQAIQSLPPASQPAAEQQQGPLPPLYPR